VSDPTDPPVVYIFHGDDPLAIEKAVAEMAAALGDPSTADLNITHLDGRFNSPEEVGATAYTMPFLATRRLVVFSNPLARLTNKTAQERFTHLLDNLPPTTALVLIIEDSSKNRKNRQGEWEKSWDVLKKSHWLIKWADRAGERALRRGYVQPSAREMKGWIINQARQLGGQFLPEAAAALANQTGSDTRLASQEILKLLTYVDFNRPVETDDVLALALSGGGQTDVFTMIDALANGSAREASRQLHRLLENQEAHSLFYLVVRQFRLLIMAREVLDEGGGSTEIMKELRQPKFVSDKLARQAHRFSMADLEDIYRHLLDVDVAVKTSRTTIDLALDLLIARLAG
jgi:DNA polymerase III subunit delta